MVEGGRRGGGERAASRLDDRVAILVWKSRTVVPFNSVRFVDNDKGNHTLISRRTSVYGFNLELFLPNNLVEL
jgi:hypothetical protein